MENDKLFGLRDYYNLTQQSVGEILGVRQQTYAEWEKGRKIIPLKHLVTLAKYYNVSFDYILGFTKTKESYKDDALLDKAIIGQKIIYIRKIYKLKQLDLAKSLNTSPSTICSYEKGNTLILTAFLYQICKEYDLSADWFLSSKTTMRRTKSHKK